MEYIEIRLANLEDADSITQLKAIVWSHDTADSDLIARAIKQQNAVSHLAFSDHSLVGFIAGFSTAAMDGSLRWEIDLLAVDARYRGLGIAARLIQANTQSGREHRAAWCRALVRENNFSSERAFARAGYSSDDNWCDLYVGTSLLEAHEAAALNKVWAIPVHTFSYNGIWLEGEITRESFLAARHRCAQAGWEVAGAVIPHSDVKSIREAQAAGATFVGTFRWWTTT